MKTGRGKGREGRMMFGHSARQTRTHQQPNGPHVGLLLNTSGVVVLGEHCGLHVEAMGQGFTPTSLPAAASALGAASYGPCSFVFSVCSLVAASSVHLPLFKMTAWHLFCKQPRSKVAMCVCPIPTKIPRHDDMRHTSKVRVQEGRSPKSADCRLSDMTRTHTMMTNTDPNCTTAAMLLIQPTYHQ